MSYYDPTSWIDSGDSLLPDVEEKVKAEKSITPERKSPGLSPIVYSETTVKFKDGSGILTLKEFWNVTGKGKITLLGNQILRQGDFNTSIIHRNPETRVAIPPPHHVHFPTKKHPDLNRDLHRYAFKVDCGSAREEILTRYCDVCNIKTEGLLLPFNILGA
jgi:hypothetical protein